MVSLQFLWLALFSLQGDPTSAQLGNLQTYTSKFSLAEEQPTGTHVGSVHYIAGATYVLLLGGNPPAEFQLHSDGNITTTVRLDRESLPTVTFTLSVTALNLPWPVVFFEHVTITVTDVNDNRPKFATPNITVFVDEDASVGSLYPIQKAFDTDSGINGSVTYSFTPVGNDSTFSVMTGARNGPQDGSIIQLMLLRELDREKTDKYSVMIIATDGGLPPLNSSMDVTVIVKDVNDNPPLFSQQSYNAMVKENEPPGLSILTVLASDADVGLNGEVRYSIKGEANIANLFTVDSKSGLITTLSTLDYEVSTSYQFDIMANNVADLRQESTVPVTVSIQDVNDNAPEVTIRLVRSTNKAVVSENKPSPELVTFVDVNDRDPTRLFNRHKHPSLTNGNSLMHFSVSYWEGQLAILTKQSLDREAVSQYVLTVTAVDLQNSSLLSSVTFPVYVGDQNDNSPVFTNLRYLTNISEASPTGSSVATVHATDADIGSNALLTYTLLSVDHNSARDWFSVSNTSGLVQVANNLDREAHGEVLLTIQASDNGQPRWTTLAQLHVVILDVNDNAPTFNKSSYARDISESLPLGSVVIQISASDADSGTNGEVTYGLDGTVNDFKVDPTTGIVKTQENLDREHVANYSLTIVAVDGGNPRHSSTTTLAITLIDENDNYPIFSQSVYVVDVKENNPPGVVANVSANDDDSGDFGRVSYRLLDNSTNATLFSVDPLYGHVYARKSFDREEQSFYQLYVLATDGGNLTSRTLARVDIMIANENDSPPKFSQSSYRFFVVETDPVGTVVGTVSASGGEDAQHARLSFSILSDPSGLFNVTQSGNIKLLGHLDRQKHSSYAIVVEARDVTAGGLVSAVPVHISVTDVNSHGPIFSQSTSFVDVIENATLGTVVYTASAADSDTGTSGRISYGLAAEKFAVNASSGQVTLTAQLDRESVDTFLLVVSATDKGYPPKTALLNLTVNVEDVNDNTPEFSQTEYTVSVSESVIPPDPLFKLSATDRDAGQNAVIDLYLQSDVQSSSFGLLADGHLTVERSLDRETRSFYNLTVVVRDRGSPPLSSTANVLVYVMDTNDNNPTFSNSTFDFHLTENTAVGSVIGALKADDADAGSNARLTYSLFSPVGINTFSVDNKTGDLTLDFPSDFEATIATFGSSILNMTAVVHDGGSPSRSATAFVTVRVLDVNDNSPRFVSSVRNAYVKENLPRGTLVAYFQAVDADSGMNGVLSYALAGDSHETGTFWIDQTSGHLYTNTSLDRELQDRYNVMVVASDHGVAPLSSNVSLSIHVLDENDWSPVLSRSDLLHRLPENVSVGTVVGRTEFEDRDLGVNGLLRYEITAGNVNQTFRIVQTSGELITTKLLDFESIQKYDLQITVYDAGDPPLSGSTQITIEVSDVNDNSPQFVLSASVYHVSEAVSIGTTVTCVLATDSDSSRNKIVMYDMVTALPADFFQINSTTGCIDTATYLDREIYDQFVLEVRATDQAIPISDRLSSIALVRIVISDVNDNYPLVTSPLTLSVYENTTVGMIIGRVVAVDGDSGVNSSLTFTLAKPSDKSFVIDRKTGDVTLRKQLDFDAARAHVLSVVTSDNGTPSLSSVTDITVDVLDSNNHVPKLTSLLSTFFVSEWSPVGAVVTALTSHDDDTGTAGRVLYALQDDYGVFSLDSRLGVLFLASSLDYSRQSLFELNVVLSDGGSPVLSSTAAINVSVIDENNWTPSFNSSAYYTSVVENSPIGSVVVRVEGDDGDPPGPNSNLTYSLVKGDRSAFHIESSTGLMTVKRNIDREEDENFMLVIRVADGGRPRRFNTTQLHVTVTDINDNVPVISPTLINISVYEDLKTPSLLTAVTGADLDSGSNGLLTYKLDTGYSSLFSIDTSTGYLTLQSTLDYEVLDEYHFKVVASDGGYPTLTSSAIVRVEVLDVNDHSPSFSSPIYSLNVGENSHMGTLIFQASASDSDSGLYGRAKYILMDNSHTGHFVIDSISGRVTVAGNVDRETKFSYQMTVLAVDCDPSRPRTGSTQLLITVTDTNDHKPEFTSAPYLVNLATTVRSGVSIVTVTARDNDAGSNSAITYHAVEGENRFSVNTKTGLVSSMTTIRGGLHTVTIEAVDGGSPRLTGTTVVVVNVMNTASVTPRFSGTISTTYQVDKYVHVGTVVGGISADPAYPGHILEYILLAGNNASKFRLDIRSGNLTVSQSLLYDAGALFVLTVMVRDMNSSSPSLAFITINVEVRSEINKPPRFTQTFFQGVISESAAISTTAVTLFASDGDTGKSGLFSYVLPPSSDVNGVFAVGPTSGKVHTLVKMDREQQSVYNFTVLAVDQGSPSKTSSTTVRVILSDVNDSPPVFVPATLRDVSIPENSSLGTFVTQLSATDADIAQNAVISFRLNDTYDSFRIDWTSGTVWLSSPLDREKQGDYWLAVEATDGLHVTTASLRVILLDMNDNSPEFSTENFVKKIPEQRGVGFPVLSILARDPDLGLDGNVFYTSGDLHTQLQVDTKSGLLTTDSNLIYTSRHVAMGDNVYELTIVASDEGEPRLTNMLDIAVEVTDINDHGPIFLSPLYNVTVREDLSIGTAILQVYARDTADSLPLAQVGYAIAGGDTLGLFWIHPSAGLLTNNMTLDYETQTEYRVEVTAYDAGNRSLSSRTVVVIDIEDVNDNTPVFGADVYAAAVTSTSPQSHSLLTVSAQDADSGAYGSVTYSIATGDPLGLLSINDASGEIRLSGDVSFVRSKVQYNVTVVAMDGGNPPRSGIATLRLTVVKTASTTLGCGRYPYTVAISEGSIAGDSILALHADEDVAFTIVGATVSGIFSVNETSGLLSLAATLDYEQVAVYRLRVLLTSRLLPPQHALCNVSVTVTGVNEFPPAFGSNIYHLDVLETASEGDTVGIVSATDRDEGQDGVISYSVVGGNGSFVFGVSERSAAIFVRRSLNHSDNDFYVLGLLAVDGGFPSLNASAVIYVHVREPNNPPFFYNGTTRVAIREDTLPGSTIACVKADDSDDPNSHAGKLLYRITDGDFGLAFVIDRQTGAVTTRTSLDRENVACYQLTIQATDMGIPPLSADARLIVCLEDVNDNSPLFYSTPGAVHLRENVPVGTFVVWLNASDADVSPNGGPFTFSLLNHSVPFSVNSSTGIVVTTGKIDREEVARYSLIFEARDSGDPQLTSRTTVEVIIDDVNDNPSQIEPFQIWLSLHVFPYSKLTLRQLTVQDADVNDNVKCKLVNTSKVDFFQVDTSSCVLSALNLLKPSVFDIVVSADDGIHSSEANGSVRYIQFNRSALSGAVSLSVNNTTAADFVRYLFDDFLLVLTDVFKDVTGQVGVVSFKLSNTSQQLGILVAITGLGANATSLPPNYLRNGLSVNFSTLPPVGRYSLDTSDVCVSSPCRNGGTCSQQLALDTSVQSISTGEKTFIYQPYRYDYSCNCLPSFTGRNCALLDFDCSSNPCLNSGLCIEKPSGGHLCQCPGGFTGRHCEIAIDHCLTAVCANGSTCMSTVTAFYCLCPPGRTGSRCDVQGTFCSSSPCQHGGTCVEKTADSICHCLPGYSGVNCHVVPYTFRTGSSARFVVTPNFSHDAVRIALQFATSLSRTVLLSVGNSSDDFLIVTVGTTLQIQTVDGAGTSVLKDTTDGQWHQLQLEVNQTGFYVWIDDCSSGQMHCVGSSKLQTPRNLSIVSLTFGSLLNPPDFVVRNYFVGSVRHVVVNGQTIEWSSALLMGGVNPGSPPSPTCQSHPCENSDLCIDLWSSYKCVCLDGISNQTCSEETRTYSFSDPGYVSLELTDDFFLTVDELQQRTGSGNTIMTRRAAVTEKQGNQIFSMDFRTSQRNGILAVSQQISNKLFLLTIDNNGLVFHFLDGGLSLVTRSIPSAALADNRWHTIELLETAVSQIAVLDDHVVANLTEDTSLHSFVNRQTVLIFIGGMAPTTQTVAEVLNYSGVDKNFQGCVGQVKVKGIFLSDGLGSISSINASTCDGGRSCIPSNGSEHVNYCQCPLGFLSVDGQCKQVGDQCVGIHCQNGGTCVNRSGGHGGNKPIVTEPTCICPDGYDGERCEIAPCRCQNGGTCVAASSVISCVCPDGFSGRLCETFSPCFSNPCFGADTPVCLDTADGTGVGYECVCDNCEGRLPAMNEDTLSVGVIAAVSLLGVLITVIIVGVLYCVWYKRTRTKTYLITHHSPSMFSTISDSEMTPIAKLKTYSDKTIDEAKTESKELEETAVDISPYQHSNPTYLDSNYDLDQRTTQPQEDHNSSSSRGESKPKSGPENDMEGKTQETIVEIHTPRPVAPIPAACESPDIDHAAQIPPGMDPDNFSEAGASSFVDDGMILPPIDIDSISDVVKLQVLPEYVTMGAAPRPPSTFHRLTATLYLRQAMQSSNKQRTSTEMSGSRPPSIANTPIEPISADSVSQVGPHKLTGSRNGGQLFIDPSARSNNVHRLKTDSPKQSARPQTEREDSPDTVPIGLSRTLHRPVSPGFDNSENEAETPRPAKALSMETVGLSNVELELLTPLPATGSVEDFRRVSGGRTEGDGVSSSDSEQEQFTSRTRASLPAPRRHLEPPTNPSTTPLGKTPSGSAPVVYDPDSTHSLRKKSRSSLDTVRTLNSDSVTDGSTYVDFHQKPDGAEMSSNYPAVFLDLTRVRSKEIPQEEFV